MDLLVAKFAFVSSNSVTTYRPDGECPLDQSKWPLKPGVLVHVSKMNNVSISQLNPRISPFKTTSVKTSTYIKYRRNRNKVYARLKRFREVLGIGRSDRPFGIKEGASGGNFLNLLIIFVSKFWPFKVFAQMFYTFKFGANQYLSDSVRMDIYTNIKRTI